MARRVRRSRSVRLLELGAVIVGLAGLARDRRAIRPADRSPVSAGRTRVRRGRHPATGHDPWVRRDRRRDRADPGSVRPRPRAFVARPARDGEGVHCTRRGRPGPERDAGGARRVDPGVGSARRRVPRRHHLRLIVGCGGEAPRACGTARSWRQPLRGHDRRDRGSGDGDLPARARGPADRRRSADLAWRRPPWRSSSWGSCWSSRCASRWVSARCCSADPTRRCC